MNECHSSSRATARGRCFAVITAALLVFNAWIAHGAPGPRERYLEALADFERYAETIWHTASFANAPADSGYWGDGASGGNGGIRGNCGVAVAYAVLVQGYPDSPERTRRLNRIRQALNYAAHTHLSGTNRCVDGKQWGHGWQSCLWAGSMALACVLVEQDLPADTVAAVKRALADEASHRAGIAPTSGFDNDSKAEENGWDSNTPSIAAAWLSGDPQAPVWLESAKSYLVNTYTVPGASEDPLADWITTTNLYPDFSLENHGFYHPTYQMVSGMSMGDSLLMARLCNPDVATELAPFAEHNVLNVWQTLSAFLLDSGEFAYPSGLDWELHDFEQNAYISWLATHFKDPLAAWADEKLSQLVRYRQIVNGDGRFVGESMSNGFFREAVEARRTAIAWLHHTYAQGPVPAPLAPEPRFFYSPHVNVLAHRGLFGFCSISFGDRIAVVIEPPALSVPTNAFLTTPRVPGIIGLGALGNPTRASLLRLETNATGFEAEFLLTHGTRGVTAVQITSNGKAIGILEIPYPVAPALGSAESFTVGIENDPLTGGTRLLEWNDGNVTITNRTGMARNITNQWVCVARNYGVAAGPAGYFRYQAASGYNRSGAAEDTLRFVTQDALGPRYAVWFPGQNGPKTAGLAAQVSWSVQGDTAVLSFPALDGGFSEIAASVSSAQAIYPPYALAIQGIEASSSQPSYPPALAFDQSLDTFWVSSGSAPGQGPRPERPEWLKATFSRQCAVAGFQVYPRGYNGGYGPKQFKMLLDGQTVFEGDAPPTTPLDVRLATPVYATNAEMIITASYDPAYPTNSRNVQVVEVVFLERAQPGTYGDWVLQHLGGMVSTNPSAGAYSSDPDKDGVPNLTEFAMGGNPSLPDAETAGLKHPVCDQETFSFRFNQRVDTMGFQRKFEQSADLVTWTEVQPIEARALGEGAIQIHEARFLRLPGASFLRISFSPVP